MLIPKDDWDDYDSSEMGFVSDDEYLDIINERVRNQQIGLDKDLLNWHLQTSQKRDLPTWKKHKMLTNGISRL